MRSAYDALDALDGPDVAARKVLERCRQYAQGRKTKRRAKSQAKKRAADRLRAEAKRFEEHDSQAKREGKH